MLIIPLSYIPPWLNFLLCTADSHKSALNDGVLVISSYQKTRRWGILLEQRKQLLLFGLVWFWLGVGNSFHPSIFICQGSRASECLESSRSIFYRLFFFFLISLLHCPLPEGFFSRCRGWRPKERRLNFSEAFLWISSSITWGSEEWSY